MNINIKSLIVNLSINLGGAISKAPSLADAIAGALREQFGETKEPVVLGINSDEVEAFVKASATGSRTLAKIQEAFDTHPAEVIEHVVGCMVGAGLLESFPDEDGVDQYTVTERTGAAPEAPTAEPEPSAYTAEVNADGIVTGFGTSAPAMTDTVAITDGEVVPEPTGENLIAFLRSDPRFVMRTDDAITRHFRESMEITLSELVGLDMVATKRRRGDGATLYRAIAEVVPATAPVETEPAPADAAPEASVDLDGPSEGVVAAIQARTQEQQAPALEQPPELNDTNVRSFLQSEERYSSRTAKAVAGQFGVSINEAAAKLEEMASAGDLDRLTRRRDGAFLFAVA